MGEANGLGYRPALDGLRAISVLLVIATHAGVPYLSQAGAVGVTMFFVLSGFLITRLLLDESARTGRVSFRRFYLKRARRLLPALVAFLLVDAAVRVFGGRSLVPVALAAVYASDIVPPAVGGYIFGELSHTWSLSLEEQFYLAWPAALMLLVRTRFALPVLAVGALASASVRVALLSAGANVTRVYIAPDTRADALLIGCLLGLTIHRIRRPAPATVVAAGLVLALACTLGYSGMMWALLPVAVAAAIVVAWSLEHHGWLAGRVPVRIGRISYGLYLWHYPVALAVLQLLGPMGLPLTLLLSFALAIGSWFIIERPFMRPSSGSSRTGQPPRRNRQVRAT